MAPRCRGSAKIRGRERCCGESDDTTVRAGAQTEPGIAHLLCGVYGATAVPRLAQSWCTRILLREALRMGLTSAGSHLEPLSTTTRSVNSVNDDEFTGDQRFYRSVVLLLGCCNLVKPRNNTTKHMNEHEMHAGHASTHKVEKGDTLYGRLFLKGSHFNAAVVR